MNSCRILLSVDYDGRGNERDQATEVVNDIRKRDTTEWNQEDYPKVKEKDV